MAINTILPDFRSTKRRLSSFSGFREFFKIIPNTKLKIIDRVEIKSTIPNLLDKIIIMFALHNIESYKHIDVAEIPGTAETPAKAQLNKSGKIFGNLSEL